MWRVEFLPWGGEPTWKVWRYGADAGRFTLSRERAKAIAKDGISDARATRIVNCHGSFEVIRAYPAD